MRKSIFGLNENVVSAFAYLFVFISGFIVLILEKENKTVRFHAMQSVIFFLPLSIISWLVGAFLGWLPVVGGLLTGVLSLFSLVAWIYLLYTALTNRMFKIPIIGDVVEAQIN